MASMDTYIDYLKEIDERKGQGLHPLPIDGAALLAEIIEQIKDPANEHRKDSLNFFIYNTLPGTTSAAGVKAAFLKEIIVGQSVVEEITPAFAFELLSHMKGGPSVEVLLDLALGEDAAIASAAADVLKKQIRIASRPLIRQGMQSLQIFWRAMPRPNSLPNFQRSPKKSRW